MSFGSRLRAARENAGLSQLALALKVGLSLDTILNWEHDRTRPQPAALGKLARALGVSLDALIIEDASGTMSPRPRKSKCEGEAKPSGKKGKKRKGEK